MSRSVDHAPARMCQPYAACSSPAASRCSAISAAFWSADSGLSLLDRGGQAPVHLGAIGFQLRFVGHRADQRMVERVLGARGEPHLIDQLRAPAARRTPDRCPARRAVRPRSGRRSPTPRSPSVWPRLSSRSMRASMAACTVAGTLTSATSVSTDVAHRARRPAPRAAPTRAPSPRRKTDSRRPARRWSPPARRPRDPARAAHPTAPRCPNHPVEQALSSVRRAPASALPRTRGGR